MASRRDFLVRLGMLAAAPALVRCGSRSAQTPLARAETSPRERPPLPNDEPVVRVRVLVAAGRDASASLGRARKWLRVGPPGDEATQVVVRAPIEVGLTGDRWSIVGADGVRPSMQGLDPVDVAPLDEKAPEVAIGRLHYPGTLRLHARPDREEGGFDVINLVGLEAYLPGVVYGELFSHWKLQTRAAQAIAARSFAACEHAWFRGRRAYDLTSTADSQVYRGRVDHGPSSHGVELTHGVMLAYEERLVPGYYSSCCGGIAAAAVDVIGQNPVNDISPLRGRLGHDVCTGAKVARWTIERPLDDLTGRLADYGKSNGVEDLAGLDRLASITVAAANAHGRPTRYALAGEGGSRAELSAPRLQAAVNYRVEPPKRSLLSAFFDVTIERDLAVFDGRGFGHGAGMCQYGAEELARAGNDHREILAWYYPSADLAKAY